ncbi:hypothetical protein BOTCAL_0115g00090 [Botryotinia calthae]|uniref:Uncharacterized protein n=1 Tax=Botryotinia calthae TaxID=38488 RepID=A0A4Y8D7J8_9HELO|nr:hypothetical protein BOTCAL_0115g00090 [Botryotinia calthae]
MADIIGRRRENLPVPTPGSLTLSKGGTQNPSGKAEVARSFSSHDSGDLSGTIQDPDEQPAILSHVFPGGLGGGYGPGFPGTGDDEIDLSGIGRSAHDAEPPIPKPAETDKGLNFMISPAPVKPKPQQVDISQFKNPDGSYDMNRLQVVLSTRARNAALEKKAERRLQGTRSSRVPVPATKSPGTAQKTTPLGRAEEAHPLRGVGRGTQPLRPRRNPNLSPIAERSSIGSKGTENIAGQKMTDSPGGGDDLGTGKGVSDKGNQPTVEEDKVDSPAAVVVIADDEGSLYSASPPGESDQKPQPNDSNSLQTSSGQSEKYRKWAAEPAESPTIEEKFREWVDRGQSSEGITAAQELEAWALKDLYDAREKHLAWLFEQRSKANLQLKIETDREKKRQLENLIIKCTIGIKEAIRLEDRLHDRELLKKNVELETNISLKRKLDELLQATNRDIERDEKVEKERLKIHMSTDNVWKRVLDMTTAEREALDIQTVHHFAAPVQRPPMILRESFAEQLLRDKWEKEDAHQGFQELFGHIDRFSNSEERDLYCGSFPKLRLPILLQRNKELVDLWKEQADEVKADRQDNWLKSEAEAEEKLLKLRQLSKPRNEEEEQAKKRQFLDALAATIAKRRAKDSEVDEKIEDIEGVFETPNLPPAIGQREQMDVSGLVATLKGKGVSKIPQSSTKIGEGPGRKGLLSDITVPIVAGDGGEAETSVAVNIGLAPKNSEETAPRTSNPTEEEIPLSEPRPQSPFRAESPLSPILDQRSGITFETNREVTDFLEYLAMVRHNEQVVKTGKGERIDPGLMREKEKRVMDPGPIDAGEEEETQKRIQIAKKRLEKAAARRKMPEEELRALEEKEEEQRKIAKAKKDLEERAAREIEEDLRLEQDKRNQELKDEEIARGKAEAEEEKKRRIREELVQKDKAEKERIERERKEMAVRDQINKEREEKEKAAKIARDKIAKDLKDKEENKKPDTPQNFAEDILTKIKNDLLKKAAGVNVSGVAVEGKMKQDKMEPDEYIKGILRKFEEEQRAWKENMDKGKGKGKGKGKPEEKPPGESDAAKKEREEKERAERVARGAEELMRKNREAIRLKNEELAKKRLKEAEKNKPKKDWAAIEKAERLAREERERETRERDRLAQERAEELKNRPELTAEQKEKRAKLQKMAQDVEDEKKRKEKIQRDEYDEWERRERERLEQEEAEKVIREKELADELKAKEAKEKRENERLALKQKRKTAEALREQKRKEREENERLEKNKKDEDDRLLNEEIDRLTKDLERKERLKKKEEDRLLREKEKSKKKDLGDSKLLKKLEEDRLARERIANEWKKKADSERAKRTKKLESEIRDPDLRKERKEREKKEKAKEYQESAAAAAALNNGDEAVGLFQNIARRIRLPDLSWLTLGGPTHLQGRAEDVASNPPPASIRTPVPADYELAPATIAWMHAHASESSAHRKISLNLTIFTSSKQHLPDAPPPHYLACHDIPALWNISQLKRHLSAIIRKAKVGEKKTMRLRIERRWLKNGSKTLMEEGFRDWESLVVVMVKEGENVREGDWKDYIREADGMAGWIEDWPGKGELRMPKDRKAWLAEALKGVFEPFEDL